MPLDLLAFGPHPDDLEIGLGATLAHHVALGLSIGLCDLTAGELGSNGTVEERLKEATDAAAVLGVKWRTNLRWPDRGIGKSHGHLDEAVEFIRRHQPRVVAIPYWEDRHPDHTAASALLTEAVFNSGLHRYSAGGTAWKVKGVCYYFINDSVAPSFVIDVSTHYETKRRALDCHASQFRGASSDVATRLNTPLFRQLVESRDAQFGALAGVAWAEGFVVRRPIVRPTLMPRE